MTEVQTAHLDTITIRQNKATSSTRNAKNHQEDVTELERVNFEALGEMLRRDTFKNMKTAVSTWANTVKS